MTEEREREGGLRGMGKQGMKTSRMLVLQTKSSLRLDCRTMAGLYTARWLPILKGRTMGTGLNGYTMGKGQWGLNNRILGKSHR